MHCEAKKYFLFFRKVFPSCFLTNTLTRILIQFYFTLENCEFHEKNLFLWLQLCYMKVFTFGSFSRSALGRARAWLRLALMQKKLADYFRHLVDQGRDVLSEYYEPRALLRSEEAAIVTGLLLSLNVVDCNLCVKVILMISRNKFY